MAVARTTLWVKQVAVPNEHGSWVFFFSPLLVGLILGGTWGAAQAFLLLAALGAFMFRQPLTTLIKILSGRRSRKELAASLFWMAIYGSLALAGAAGLWLQGYRVIFWLVIPAVPVLAWHLWLVSRRAERRKPGVEIVGSAVLALLAPAGYWIGRGAMDLTGWMLWLLVVLQNAASIVYAYLRLEQRVLALEPDLAGKIRMARRALSYGTFNLLLTAGLSLAGIIPGLVWLAFTIQWVEIIYGTLSPAIKVKPVVVGVRQMVVSILFTVCLILTWLIKI